MHIKTDTFYLKIILTLMLFISTCSGTTVHPPSGYVDVSLIGFNIPVKRFQYTDFLKAYYTRNWKKTIELYERGRNERYAPILAARAYQNEKNYVKAAETYETALKKHPLLKDFIYYLAGAMQEDLKNYAQANRYFFAISPEGVYYRKSRERGYENLIRLQKYHEVLAVSDPLNLPDTSFYKAKAASILQRKTDSVKHLDTFFSGDVPARLYRKALDLWTSLLKPEMSDKSLLKLAAAALAVNRYPDALLAIGKIKTPSDESKNLLASVYLKTNASLLAQKIYAELRNKPGRFKDHADYMYYRCFSFLGRKNDYLNGIKTLFEKPGHKFQASAAKILFSREIETNIIDPQKIKMIVNSNEELITYFFHIIDTIKDKTIAGRIRLAKHFLVERATPHFRAFLHNFLAENYEKSGNLNEAVSHYTKSAVLTSNFYSGLSYLALRRLGKLSEKIHTEIRNILIRQKNTPELKKTIEAIQNAPAFQSVQVDAFLEMGDSLRPWFITSQYLEKNGYHHLYSIMKYYLSKNFLSGASEYTLYLRTYLLSKGFYNLYYSDIARLAFPAPYREYFNSVQNPVFLRALTFGESFFNEYAYSRAGAIGLTQKMPDTARWLARNRQLEVSRIFEPERNIQYGDKFISWLLKRHGNPIDALGSYNAGPNRFRRYIKKFKPQSSSDAQFVSKIPLDETKEYIVKVINAYVFLLVTGNR